MMRRREWLLGGLATAALAGCVSPQPDLYTLAAVPGPVLRGGPRTVMLRGIGLARYLERPEIVRSSEDYRLDIRANAWWGEPLGAMLSRVLVQGLSQRLPDSSVFPEGGAISAEGDTSVEINLQRMDADRAGVVQLRAQIAVQSRGAGGRGEVANFATQVAPGSTDLTATVAAMSLALGQLADRVAVMLQGTR
jgi:uncharacterized lipoprotein YmbA